MVKRKLCSQDNISCGIIKVVNIVKDKNYMHTGNE